MPGIRGSAVHVARVSTATATATVGRTARVPTANVSRTARVSTAPASVTASVTASILTA